MTSTQDLVTVAGGNMSVNTPDFSDQWLEMLAASGVPQDVAQQAVSNQNFGAPVEDWQTRNEYNPGYEPQSWNDESMYGSNQVNALEYGAGGAGGYGGGGGGGGGVAGPGVGLVPPAVAGALPPPVAAALGALGVGGGVPAPGGAPTLNVGMGSDFLPPILGLLGQIYGIGENRRQFDITSAFQKAQTLAQLNANPRSAFELASLRQNMGLGGTPFEGDIRQLIGATTQGASGQGSANPGTGNVTVPNTLTGGQLGALQGDPNASGIVESFAGAAGNPDILKRSIAALLPSGFQGIGGGM